MWGDDSKLLIMGIVLVATTVLELWFVGKKGIFTGAEKRRQDAISKGHVAQGMLRRSRRIISQNGETDYYLAAYMYSVNGKEYQITGVRSEGRPIEKIEVYYDNNPAKAFVRGQVSSNGRVFLLILPWAITFMVALLLK